MVVGTGAEGGVYLEMFALVAMVLPAAVEQGLGFALTWKTLAYISHFTNTTV